MSEPRIPGVVLINKYDTPGTTQDFSRYLNYISRENATQPKDFDQYLEYMDNPQKQANLFTAEDDFLTHEQKDRLHEQFTAAEQKDGVMWETVISFDNAWLEEHGLYDAKTGWTDEKELKRLTRGAVKRIEDQEHLSLTWTGAIHHNTDNLHIHLASVETIPRRKEKKYQIVEFPQKWLEEHHVLDPDDLKEMQKNHPVTTTKAVDGTLASRDTMSRLKQAVLDETGRPFFCRNQMEWTDRNTIRVSLSQNAGVVPEGARVLGTYRTVSATWKEKTMDSAKSYLVHEIVRDDDSLKKINDLIRNGLVNPAKERMGEFSTEDQEIARDFMKLYHDLTISGVSRRDWTYGTNKISRFRPDLDQLGEKILTTYFPRERAELDREVRRTANEYRRAYGNNEKADRYEAGRQDDLHKRMGNAILYHMRTLDRQRSGERGNSSDGCKAKSRKPKPKRPKAHRGTAGQQARRDALQAALQKMQRETEQMLNESRYREQEEQYQFQKELAEEEWQEKQRIAEGERQ